MTVEKFDPPYPIEGLTPKIKALANYINRENQSPLPMCAISALAGCTLAIQGLIKVKWRDAPASPVGMIFIVEALSGERKTANDQIALREHRRFDEQQSRFEAEDAKQHARRQAVWDSKRKALLRAIGQGAAKDIDTSKTEELLEKHEKTSPSQRKRPRMLISDITAPAVARHLSEKYPYAGLVSDEGGVILSSGALSNPAMINSIWDSGDGVTDRMGRGRTEVYDASLTVYLQVQPGVFEYFLARQGHLTHASGNSSRWLYTNPPSKQGTRFISDYVEIYGDTGESYHTRIRELLSQYDREKLPRRKEKTFTRAARQYLDWFSNKIEKELAENGRFYFMRGVATKATENCARLAASMHEFEGGTEEIDAQVVTGAIKIVAWHLNQYRMRFAPLTQMERDILELEESIFKHYHRWAKTNGQVKGAELARYAPKRLRQIDKLLSVVLELALLGRLQVWDESGGSWKVNLHFWIPDHAPAPSPEELESGVRFRYHPNRQQMLQRVAQIKALTGHTEKGDGKHLLWPGCHLP
ncbi:DUF3987 domain-containing protein [Variovorax gossypii]|uniref:DUF3987 domain-containing protein n=1 Tax=Variovorax gossypii TaxID=1679495 RepID=A0A431TPS7_9BURK|nr:MULTISPECIES: YfjI family protein [Variovorax]MDR6522153.1 hypothetical protein [Variovorax paradoxus]RTQ35548.1 DUF3987 domain-containing protein [Variovorax gossypii]